MAAVKQFLPMQTDHVRAAVFLSHAGPQKRIFVDYIHASFTGSGISVFLDQHSLDYGRTQADMYSAVDGCCVGESASCCYDPSNALRGITNSSDVPLAVSLLLQACSYLHESL
jgi:hypothetical protein